MPSDHPVASVFYDASIAGSLDQRNTHMINPGGSITSHYHSAATYYTQEGEAMFALASSSGNILLVKMPPLGMQGKILTLNPKCANLSESRLLFSSAETFKKPL